MQFQLKHGHTGHYQNFTFDRGIKGEGVMNLVLDNFKISPKDQLLITKMGHVIQPKQHLEKVFWNQIQNQTMSAAFNKRIDCIIIFNLKQLSKLDETYEEKAEAQLIQELHDNLMIINNESSTAFPFESLNVSYTEDQLQRYQRFVQKINSLKESYITLAREYSETKFFNFKVEQVWERCKNQKKSAFVLIKVIKQQFIALSEKINEVSSLKQELRKRLATNDQSLRQNSGFFESKKKNENTIALYQTQLNNINKNRVLFQNRFKEDSTKWKNQFKNQGSGDVNFGQKRFTEKLQEYHTAIKRDYDQILGLFSQVVQSNQSKYINALEIKLQKSIQNVKNNLPSELSRIIKEITDYYVEFRRSNQANTIKVKKIFIWYNQIIHELSNSNKHAESMRSAIKSEIEQDSKRKSSFINKKSSLSLREISGGQFVSNNAEQTQIKRRVKFKKILNYIQSYGAKICLQEELLRKKFVNQIKCNQEYEFVCLKNIKVPEIELDDNNSSDLQLMKISKLSNLDLNQQSDIGIQQFVIYSFNIVLQKLKSINLNDNDSKTRNLQQIVKSLSDVFAKVYNNKISNLLSEKEQMNSRMTQFQNKISSLQTELQNKRYEIIDLTRKISEKQEKLISREKQRSEQINKERSKYQKLSSQFKLLEKNLSKQTKMNQELYNQILKSEDDLKDSMQLNDSLKELLAQKEIQIIEIQKKLEQRQRQITSIPNQSSQNDLKSAVLHNFSKDLNSKSQNNDQIDHLNQQIADLQRQNEELQEEYQELSSQLRKIITKQTQDIQTQTIFQEPVPKSIIRDEITIREEITVGQNALFMPFSNNIYVGVNHSDDDRTLCNINNMHTNSYLLDFSNFNHKTRELLSQCSFLIVLHVESVEKQGKSHMVKGQIRHIFGFEDDNTNIRNYASLLPN